MVHLQSLTKQVTATGREPTIHYGAFNCMFLSCHVRVLDVCKWLSIRLRSCVSSPVTVT